MGAKSSECLVLVEGFSASGLRGIARVIDCADIHGPRYAEATTVVPNVGVGGGNGLSVLKSGWICDSRREGAELLRRRNALGLSTTGISELGVPTDRLCRAAC